MPVKYSENDLVLKRLKGKLLSKIKQLEVEQVITAIKVMEIEDVRISKL